MSMESIGRGSYVRLMDQTQPNRDAAEERPRYARVTLINRKAEILDGLARAAIRCN